jgi:hypothetical protein
VIRKVIAASGLLLIVAASNSWAQHKAEITPWVGWSFGSTSVTTISGDIRTKAAVDYGLTVDVNVRPGGQLELSYSRTETELTLKRFAGGTIPLTDVSVNNFQIGGLGYVMRGQSAPFASFTLGAAYIKPAQGTITDGDRVITISDTWRFSMIFGLGVKYMASERIGIRLQGHISALFLDTGGGMWCGFGGCSLGLFGTGVLNGDVSAGLILAI